MNRSKPTTYVELPGKVKFEKGKALLFYVAPEVKILGDKRMWIPLSQIKAIHPDRIEITEWTRDTLLLESY